MLDLDSEGFRSILERSLGATLAREAGPAFHQPSSVSIRYNPSKIVSPEQELSHMDVLGDIPWCKWGRVLSSRPVFTLDPLFHAGCYYVQDSSAMFPGYVFRKVLDSIAGRGGKSDTGNGRIIRVLDLCAAPGGKTTDLATSLREAVGDRFVLVANEVMKARASVLADNTARWGDANVVVTGCDPKAFASMEGFFDIIVADVPCSGEGMFRKDPKALEDWTPELPELCAARQKRILADVWPALRDGGTMVYSTCTFEKCENDENVGWMTEELHAETHPCLKGLESSFGDTVVPTGCGFLLVPGLVRHGEGQYCSAVVKDECGHLWTRKVKPPRCEKSLEAYGKNLEEASEIVRAGEKIVAVPQVIAGEVAALESLHPIRKGVAVGTEKGRDLIPDEDLALCTCFSKDSFPRVEVDRDVALRFLHRDAIVLSSAPKGHVVISFSDHPLGFVKNLGSRVNNLHLLSRRILMSIN